MISLKLSDVAKSLGSKIFLFDNLFMLEPKMIIGWKQIRDLVNTPVSR